MNILNDLKFIQQRYVSNVLWHFTGYNKSDSEAYEILKSIIHNKILRRGDYRTKILIQDEYERFGYPCLCVCDIPFKELAKHTLRYGKFAIAFNKYDAIKDGNFNPILYVDRNHKLYEYILNNLIPHIDPLTKMKEVGLIVEKFLYLLGTQVKPCDLTADLKMDASADDQQTNNFYYDREWRSAFDWEFNLKNVEAVIIPESFTKDMKKFLYDGEFNNMPIIPYEMIEKL